MSSVPTQGGELRRRVKIALVLARRPPLVPGARGRGADIGGTHPPGAPGTVVPPSASPAPHPSGTAASSPASSMPVAPEPAAPGPAGPARTLLMSPVPVTNLDDDDGWTVPLPAHRRDDEAGDA